MSTRFLDRLALEHPDVFDAILYVEQPFPYDLEANKIDVTSVSRRKPLMMDESAHNWQLVRLGRELGWTGVALKTCKTQSGAILTLCWAKAHNMDVMVQDLTNPMLAQISHVLLAAHAGTIMGVESNSMQFYPQASLPEAQVHPGLYQRRHGHLDLRSIQGPRLWISDQRNSERPRHISGPVGKLRDRLGLELEKVETMRSVHLGVLCRLVSFGQFVTAASAAALHLGMDAAYQDSRTP